MGPQKKQRVCATLVRNLGDTLATGAQVIVEGCPMCCMGVAWECNIRKIFNMCSNRYLYGTRTMCGLLGTTRNMQRVIGDA